MKNRIFTNSFLSLPFFGLALITLVGSFAFNVSAQKQARLANSKSLLAEAADLDQCRNGKIGNEEPCTGNNWVNGSLNPQNTHYKEGDTVPYRYKFSGLTTGVSSQVTIGYDTIHSDKHAIDYLTTFNRTETTADPCSDILSAAICSNPTTFPIPIDPNVVNGNLTGNQIPGNFTLYGGEITSVSAYTVTPQGGGTVRTTITITFTPSISNPILAVGGHIATRADWGAGNSAIAISGAPYHMRLLDLNGSGGNQDRSLQVDELSTLVTIIKDVFNGGAPTGFNFTSTAGLPATFVLTDDGNDNSSISTPSGITSEDFGVSGTITVTEVDPQGSGFQLIDIACTGTAAGNISRNVPDRQVTINVQNNESVTCTFTNAIAVPTAADATLSGKVVNAKGRGLSRVKVILTDSEGSTRFVMTNAFGYYRFTNLEAGKTYVLSGATKQYTIAPIAISLTDDLIAPNLIAQ